MRMIRLYDEENVNINKKSIKNQVKKKTICLLVEHKE